jgi:predicted membrane-bound mannosyltransferase
MRGAVLAAALAVLSVSSAGCSSDGDSTAATPSASAAAAAPGRPLTRVELANQLGNLFDRALYRVAVMSQPGDDAADLGQSLPTGTVRDVECRQAAAGEGREWSCSVGWESVDGRRDSTPYRVTMSSRGCFLANASPPLAQRFDATIGSYSEHPLNRLESLRRGCQA